LPGSGHEHKSYCALEGAVRSTKTSTGSFSFTLWAMSGFNNQEFAFCGKTIGTCRRNVIRPLKKMLASEPGFKVVDKISAQEGPHLIISYCGHKNTFWIFGGNDESSQDLIQGITLAGIFLDEVLLMPLSFVNQSLSRLSIEGAKAWFTMNPEAPSHEIYVNILDPFQAEGKLFYLCVTMDDNPSMSQEAKDRISSQWPAGSVWYERNVLGHRVSAEGAIFSFFSSDPKYGYVIDYIPDDIQRWLVSADYGQDHPTTFGLYGFSPKLTSWILIKEYYATMRTNPDLSRDFGSEILKFNNKDILPESVDIDSGGGGLSLINQLRSDYPNLDQGGIICHAIKQDVNAELMELASAIYTHKFRYYIGCKRSISETANYRWKKKPAGSGKEEPLKENDDGPDRDRYMWNRAKGI
jgi:PBSX family phage terminase large subunit